MNKRVVALLTTLASLPLVAVTAVGTAAPATAGGAPSCAGLYPPGQAYGIRRSPSYAVVRKGTLVVLSGRLYRGSQNCPGLRVGFYKRGRGQTGFTLPPDHTATTSSRTDDTTLGLAHIASPANADFRWFANYNVSAVTVGANSGVGLVQVH